MDDLYAGSQHDGDASHAYHTEYATALGLGESGIFLDTYYAPMVKHMSLCFPVPVPSPGKSRDPPFSPFSVLGPKQINLFADGC